jgi:hypothetical protein
MKEERTLITFGIAIAAIGMSYMLGRIQAHKKNKEEEI